ncbi:hypothetical protein [Streptomyces sporangiiformans]|uniref:Uncharacterized protein n=1 Tax=Streptomyces sporangiiformans TaxID=2315329 RepID=A0A505DKJ4_9ACTN|nr:hypothetical protein [Streptomyces sporangiiformans]TPQ22028.1 hypothetical protein FGD71_011535 [Streptomyces sporangiiformans]
MVEAEAGALSSEISVRLADFMGTAEDLLLAPGTRQDPLSDDPDNQVRVGIMTDGTWVWDLAWADLVAMHRVCPSDEFLEHVKGLNFRVPQVSEERIMEICAALDIN